MDLMEISIAEFFKQQSEKYSSKVFMEYFGDIYTYRETDLYSDIVAEKLSLMGVEKGDRVAIWAENSPVWIIYLLSLFKLNAVPVLVNTSYKAEELENILLLSRVKHIIYGSGHKGINFKEVLYQLRLKGKAKILNYIELPQSISFDLSKRERMPLKNIPNPHDPAVIMLTSGSTKIPKGVLLSHFNVVNNARSIVKDMGWNQSDRLCLSVPLFHCFGFTSGFLAMVAAGATINILNVFRTKSVLTVIENNRCTILNGVPSMFLSMTRNPILKEFDISSLKSGIIAGAPVIPTDYINISRILGLNNLQQSYGQTETSPCVTMTKKEDTLEEKSSTAGRICSNQEIRIRNLKTGELCPQGISGEIEVKGYNVMCGYDGQEKETRKVLSEDGWLKTGDLGFLNEKGYLKVTGRLNEIIIRGGENISPLELESCISSMEGIIECKVLSVPDPVMTEEIVAVLIMDSCWILSEEDVKRYVGDRLAGFKVPKYVIFLSEFPRLDSGKVDVMNLKKLILEEIVKE